MRTLIFILSIGSLTLLLIFTWEESSYSIETLSSWYSVKSCEREGTSGIMACDNGSGRALLNDKNYTCASWDYPFGTRLSVTNTSLGKTTVVTVTDRGPTKTLYAKGITIDLSKSAFNAIAPLEQGQVEVQIGRIEE